MGAAPGTPTVAKPTFPLSALGGRPGRAARQEALSSSLGPRSSSSGFPAICLQLQAAGCPLDFGSGEAVACFATVHHRAGSTWPAAPDFGRVPTSDPGTASKVRGCSSHVGGVCISVSCCKSRGCWGGRGLGQARPGGPILSRVPGDAAMATRPGSCEWALSAGCGAKVVCARSCPLGLAAPELGRRAVGFPQRGSAGAVPPLLSWNQALRRPPGAVIPGTGSG